MDDKVTNLWEEAADIDPTLKLHRKNFRALLSKRVIAEEYSRSLMFSRIMRGQISLFKDLSVPIKGAVGDDKREFLSESIRTGFPHRQLARIQSGRKQYRSKIKVPELMRRWEQGRAIVSVTDLHFRDTRFGEKLDISPLSDFNVLCSDPELVDKLEMMTLVVSSKGNITDNHADDCDGTNHCFVGKKLWLAWDRIEGSARGFQDVDRDVIKGQAAFDMETFLSLPSSRWFTVKENETLFLPGNLAHKVLTLEHYIGVGSFHVALPSYIRSLRRWIIYDTHDVGPKKLLGRINRAVIQRVEQLKGAGHGLRKQWGPSYMQRAVKSWDKHETPETKALLLRNPTFAEFFKVASAF